ncbi:uncharacterized protein LOC143187002 isoform X2 [Calliopsis andreniformis]|uniref:uncharacterized protein LOC143187002 isoform X2 n=1 Tax=Calliopsis andreniformis TaxID=337506 RepID=UPI003FCE752C
MASDRSRIHSQSTYDCYCKTRPTTAPPRSGIQTDRSRVRLLTSKSSLSKTEATRSAKKGPLTPARLVIEDQQPDTKRSTTTLPISPVLSPETSAVLEDMQKLVKDAEIKIKEINMLNDSNRVRRAVTLHPDEAPLDDEDDHLLYIRERVSYKFEEANGWIDAGHTPSKNQEYFTEGSLPIKLKKITDFSAPKFKTCQEHYKDFMYHGNLGLQNLGLPMPGVPEVSEHVQEFRDSNETHSPDRERNKKMDNFSVRVGPSVSIQRELVAQNLEDIHISPDPSFVQECNNVGTYMIQHDFCSRSSPTRKEKVIKISGKSDNVKCSRKPVAKRRKTILKEFDKASNRVNCKRDSVPGERSEVPGATNNSLEGNKNRSIEDIEMEAELGTEITEHSGDRDLESTISSDVSGDQIDHSDQKLEKESLKKSGHSISNIHQETEIIKEEIKESPTRLASETKSGVQVRFREEIVERTEEKNIQNGEAAEKENTKTKSKAVQFENSNIPDNDIEELKSPSFLKETETLCDVLLLNKMAKEEKNRRQEKKVQKKEAKKNEHYKMIDERFDSILKKYCNQDEETPKADSHLVSSIVDSSEESEVSDSLDDLYNPHIEELDNVLLSYDKIIDNVARSTKMIDRFLTRPEIKEICMQDGVSETSESSTSTPLYKSKVEAKKKNTLCNLQVKRNIEPRSKDPVLKDRSLATNKRANNRCDSHTAVQTKTVKPSSVKTLTNIKGNNAFKKRYIPPNNSDKFPRRNNLKSQRHFNIPKKLANESSEDSVAVEESRLRQLCFQKESDSSSQITFSINTLSTSSDTRLQNIDETKTLEAKKTVDLKSTSMQDDLQIIGKENLDYSKLYNMVHSDVLKQGFAESKHTPIIVEHLISRVLQEETRFIEDKIKNALNVNQIVPALMKSLLENLQNLKTQNLELHIPENDVASGDAHTIETARANFGNLSEKQCLQIEEPVKDENCNTESIKSNRRIIEEPSNFDHEEIPAEPADTSKSQSSINKENISYSRSERTDKINSDIEELKEASNKTDPTKTAENSAHLMAKGNDNDNLSSAKSYSSVVSQRLANEENGIGKAVKNDAEQYANEAINLHAKDAVSEATDKSLTIAKSEVKTVQREEPTNSRQNLLSSAEGKEELLKKEDKLLESQHPVVIDPAPSNDNVQQASSSDSLHDCASLKSSPRDIPNIFLNTEKSSQKASEAEELPETKVVEIDRLRDQRDSYGIINKEKILSDLYEDVHKKLSIKDTNCLSAADQNYRFSKSISTIESNKCETQSDISHSDGELYMLSSGSYSLGEVRMSKKNRSDGETTNPCDDSITIFVTKEMLTSWNESSKGC